MCVFLCMRMCRYVYVVYEGVCVCVSGLGEETALHSGSEGLIALVPLVRRQQGEECICRVCGVLRSALQMQQVQ